MFYGSLKKYHGVVSETSSTMRIISAALDDLEDYYKRMMASEKNVYWRMLQELSKDNNEETKTVKQRLLIHYRALDTADKKHLDSVARKSVGRSYEKFTKEKQKWDQIESKVQDKDTFLTATSRRVEALFGTLKQLERTQAKLSLRRTMVVAWAMYNQTSEWLMDLKDPECLEEITRAMVERRKNEKKAKELEKLDRKKFKDQNEREPEENAEISEEDEIVEEEEEEIQVGEKNVDEPEINKGDEMFEESAEPDMDYEEGFPVSSVPENE